MTHSCLNFSKFRNGFRGTGNRGAPGRGRPAPGLFWLGGFKSDMKGTKAEALSDWARQNGRACVRFDYSGHGESGGDFRAGTIGRWLEESLAVFEAHAAGTAGCRSAPRWAAGSRCCWRASCAAARPRASRAGQHRRPGADRAGGRFHRGADVAALSRQGEARDRDKGRLARGRPTTASPIRSRAA